jgi:hypothetical protein
MYKTSHQLAIWTKENVGTTRKNPFKFVLEKTIDDAMLWLPDFHFYRSRASGLKLNALNGFNAL